MRKLHLFAANRLWLGMGALITSAGLAVATAGAQSPSTESERASDQPAASTTTKNQDADRENADSADSQDSSRRQDRDREDAHHRGDANRKSANRSDSADRDHSDRDHTNQSRGDVANRDNSNRDNSNQNVNRNDSSQNNRSERRDQRQYSARPDNNTKWQAGQQTAGQRQQFGVTWADDDEHWTVEEVASNSIAARAGLRSDDEVVSLNGRQIGSSRDFKRYLNSNQRVPVIVLRDGRRQTIWLGGNLQAGSQFNANQYSQNQQNQFQQNYSQSTGDIHAFLGVQLDDQYQSMAVVKQVYQNTPAQQAGLRAGDTITSVNGQRVASPQELTDEVQQLQPGSSVQVQFSRPQARTVQVRLGQRSADASQASYQSNDQDRSRSRDDSQNRSQNRHDDSDDSSDQDEQHSQD